MVIYSPMCVCWQTNMTMYILYKNQKPIEENTISLWRWISFTQSVFVRYGNLLTQ